MKAVQYTSGFIKPKYKYYILQSNHKTIGVLLSSCIPAYYLKDFQIREKKALHVMVIAKEKK